MDTSRLIDDINNGNFNEKLLDIYIDKERLHLYIQIKM